jgi:hypothetical protein|tara:strand:- start:73 stop:240 length:168 start_codon:yes stop_codon:yes gene_type:complete
MKDLEAEIDFMKTRINTLETHLEELKQYYFTTRMLDGYIIKYHSLRLDKLDDEEF